MTQDRTTTRILTFNKGWHYGWNDGTQKGTVARARVSSDDYEVNQCCIEVL